MATTKLIIRDKRVNEDGKCVIFIQYTHLQKQVLFSTGQKIEPKLWKAKDQKVSIAADDHKAINAVLRTKESEIGDIAREAEFNNTEPTVHYVKSVYEKKRQASTPKNRMDFFPLFEQFIQDRTNSGQYAKSTLKRYKTTYSHLRQFSQKKAVRIALENIDDEFYEKFTKYMYKECNMINTTVGNEIKSLKTFLNWTVEKEYNTKVDFKKFKKPSNETDIVYLTREELDHLFTYDLSKHKKLEKVRDLFILGCTTGLRFSDLTNLSPENIKDDVIELRTIKTKDALRIPLTPYSRQIIMKYQGNLPRISNQKMNSYLKELCDYCGIEESVSVVQYAGVKRVERTLPKSQLISSHTARRTYVTLSLEAGMRPEVVMKVTGHKDYRTMQRYVKIAEEVTKEEMMSAWGEVPQKLKVI